jgi:iron complex transport system permease protein
LAITAAVLAGGLALTVGVCSLFGPLGLDELSTRMYLARISTLLAAALAGMALSAAGVALQGLLGNPLAEPYILGVSSGAGVGVLLGLAVGSTLLLGPTWIVPGLAFLGAISTCLAVYAIAHRRGRLDPYTLILSGVVINAFNGAIMLAIHLYIDPYRMARFIRWSMGQVPDVTDWTRLTLAAGAIGLAWLGLLLRSAGLNALGLGDAVALSAGVAVHRLRIEIFVLASLATAAAVALAGPIGFVGLIVPHICRALLGPDHRRLTIVAGFAGAIFLTVAHTICANVGPSLGVSDIPVGILTALTGGPFFIVLLRRRSREVRL